MIELAFGGMSYVADRRTTTLTDLLGTQDVSKEVAKLEGRIFQLYGHNQVNCWRHCVRPMWHQATARWPAPAS